MRRLGLRTIILLGIVAAVMLWATSSASAANTGVYEAETPANTGTGEFSLGMRFTSTLPGYQVNAIRYWRHASESGSHTGKLWDGSCNLLATATFSGETSSGWQTADLDGGPVALTEDAVYIVSVTVNTHYSADDIDTARAGPVLAVEAGGFHSRYSETAGACPSTSSGSQDYWVDALVDVPDDPPPEEEGATDAQLTWWGIWALVGLSFVSMIAPAFLRVFDVRHGLGGRFERG